MITFFRTIAVILLIFGLAVLGLFLTNHEYLLKGAWATYLHGEKTGTISDARFFATRKISATDPHPWLISSKYNSMELSDTLRSMLEKTESVAFLIVKNDSILFEEYWDNYSDTSHSNSFSMAKSITTLLAQKAIQDGYIKSWEDNVNDYLPKIEGPFANELKLKHLSTMTAGLQWNEHYTNPFDITARSYYSSDIEETMYDYVPVVTKPGTHYEYQSGATQLLGLVIEKATGKTVSDYTSETLWKSMGAEHDAYWHLDKKGGEELTYCCFNSNIRDFARFGKMLIHDGKWDGQPVIDSSFLYTATRSAPVSYYGWSFWIFEEGIHRVYSMRGLLGQYVIVVPEKDLIICRLGKHRIKNETVHPTDYRVMIEEGIKYFGN